MLAPTRLLEWSYDPLVATYFAADSAHRNYDKHPDDDARMQTTTFASHTASIHLCAIRYLMLMHNKLAGHKSRIGDMV